MENFLNYTFDENESMPIEALVVSLVKPEASHWGRSRYIAVLSHDGGDTIFEKMKRLLSDTKGYKKASSETILDSFLMFDNPANEVEIEFVAKITTEAHMIFTKESLEGNFRIIK